MVNDKEYKTITIEKRRDCYILYRVRYTDKNDFFYYMLARFYNTVDQLKFQFGLSILELFDKSDRPLMIAKSEYYSDFIELAKDKKFKLLIEQTNDKLKEHYDEFIICGK